MKKILLITVFLLNCMIYACPDDEDKSCEIEIPKAVKQAIYEIVQSDPFFLKEINNNKYEKLISFASRLDSNNIKASEKYDIFFFILENDAKEEFKVNIFYDKEKDSAYILDRNVKEISWIIRQNFGSFSDIVLNNEINDFADVACFLYGYHFNGVIINKLQASLLKFSEDGCTDISKEDIQLLERISKLFFYPSLSFDNERKWILEFMVYSDEEKFIEECKFSGVLTGEGFLEIKKFEKKRYLVSEKLAKFESSSN